MPRQLVLLEAPSGSWRLDDDTCERGRAGVAAARAALRSSRRPRNGREAGAGGRVEAGDERHRITADRRQVSRGAA